jgi:diguanylate cyclase (GGDEF)-like protein
MYRQFWLAIITCMLLAFGGSLIASMLSARAYLESQLSIKNSDNAAALALSMSQSHPDAVMIELTVTALFDTGHYELVRVVDPEGRTIAERASWPLDLDAPEWFARWLPIRAVPGQAQISKGWQQVGTLTLASDSRLAYGALWNNVWQTTAALALASLVGGLLGSIILGRLKAPLQAVIDQATAISERRFVTIDEPAVPELRRLALAMNTTVGRLRTIFEEEAARLEIMRREANCDPLTGLANRGHFMARLRQALDAEDAGEGTLLLIRLAGLAGINRRLGRAATDAFLRQAAESIGTFANPDSQGIAARLNGADFAIALPAGRDARAAAHALLAALIEAGKPYVEGETIVSIGLGSYCRPTDIETVLARVDAALAAAEAEGVNAIREAVIAAGDRSPRTAEQWAEAITRAVDRKWLRLVSFPVVDVAGRLSHRECPLRLLAEEDGEWLAAGRFLPLAERLRLTPALDLAAVALGLRELTARPDLPGLAINLSASSVADASFRQRLLGMLGAHANEARRLWLEVAENGALRHVATFGELSRGLKAAGCRIGLEHFGHQFSQIGLLHDLGLDYLKVDASFVRGLDSNRGNAAFLEGLSGIAHGIGLQVLAEGVATRAEWLALVELGFDGVTGPAVSASRTNGMPE